MDIQIFPGSFPPLSKNILRFDAPDNYRCRVMSYVASFSRLTIFVSRKNNSIVDDTTYYLTMSGVSYYDGTMGWDGADLGVGSRDEFSELLVSITPTYDYLPSDRSMIVEDSIPIFLYCFRTSTRPIRIMVQGKIILSTSPPDLGSEERPS